MRDYRTVKRRKLRPFGPVWDGAGIRGFAKEGYWYHSFVPGLKRALARSTFVTKTITTDKMKGHMALDARFRPSSLFPDCIYLNYRHGFALNAVGLSGPGIRKVLAETPLVRLREPFFISYMPVLSGSNATSAEVQQFVHEIDRYMDEFRATHMGIQLNISCPNTGTDIHHLVQEAGVLLDQFTKLRVPVVVKLDLLVTPAAAKIIAEHPTCTGLCIANSVRFGTVFPKWWWEKNFPNGSPLEKYGKGALSGAPIFHEVLSWLRDFRSIDRETYVNAGGGIMEPNDVDALYHAGADSIFFSSVMMLRPWRVPAIVRRAHRLFPQ